MNKATTVFIKCIKHSVIKWQTVAQLQTTEELIKTKAILIRRGIFQGDIHSPLLSSVTMVHLSDMQDKARCGFICRMI